MGPQRYVEARVKRRLYSFKKVSIASLVEERREKKKKPLCSISSLTTNFMVTIGLQRYVKGELTSVSIDFAEC